MTSDQFHWVCGKCGSRSIYRDDDAIACPMCGNRYYEVIIRALERQKVRGVAPKKVYEDPYRPPVKYESGHWEQERMTNIVTGADLRKVKREEPMSKKGKCVICGRENMCLPARNMCGKCYFAEKEKISPPESAPDKAINPPVREPGPPETPTIITYNHVAVPREIPLTIRLTIDVTVRVNGVMV